MKSNYRLKAYDEVNDIWLLQERVFWFLFKTISVGSKEELNDFINEKEG